MSSWCLAQHLTQRRPVFLCVVWEVSVQLVLTLCQLPGGRKDGRPCLCSAGRWWQFIPTFWYHVLPVVVVQSLSCVRHYDLRDYSVPGFPVLHHLPEFAQTHDKISKVQQYRLRWQGTGNCPSPSSLNRSTDIKIHRITTDFYKFYDSVHHRWLVNDSQQYSYKNTRI